MIRRGIRAASIAAVILVVRLGLASAQSTPQEVRLAPVPATLSKEQRDSLTSRRVVVERAIDEMNAAIVSFNARCASFRADDVATRTYCEAEFARLTERAALVEAQKLAFNAAVEAAVVEASRARRPSIDRIYVPSPAVAEEQLELDRSPAAWLAAARDAVGAAVKGDAASTRQLLAAVRARRAPDSPIETTRLSELRPGDILLVAPADPRRDAAGAALGEAIRGGDLIARVAEELAAGDLLRAAQQETAPVSHALTFVKGVGGTFLFLDHTSEGSRILDDRMFLAKYGAREMYLARPHAIVDGRALWQEARAAALQPASDYGFFGDNAVCSERAGIAVARVTGSEPDRRLGPVDITPGDFFDTEGATGKHFSITRLRITPTQEHPGGGP